MEPDAQIIGFWRRSFAGACSTPDYVLASNLIRDMNPPCPMLFQVAAGKLPVRKGVGQESISVFKTLVARNTV